MIEILSQRPPPRTYELIQAQHPKFRKPRMPHAVATRMLHIWYHVDRHEQWKRVAQPVIFVKDLGLALAPKNVSGEVDNNQAFS